MQVLGAEKIASWAPSRKAKWCKMQGDYSKKDKNERA